MVFNAFRTNQKKLARRITGDPALLLLAFVGILSVTCSARRIEDWPFDRLMKEADLVVIAKPTTSVDSGEQSTENVWKAKFLGVNTSFHTLAVIKGHVGPEFKVLHYRDNGKGLWQDGPLLVKFRLDAVHLDSKSAHFDLGPPDYLMFLKSRQDGRFEPISGQVDSELSVREVFYPLPAGIEPPKTPGEMKSLR